MNEKEYENAIIALFQALGYTYTYGPDIQRDYTVPLLEDTLAMSMRKVNPALSATGVADLLHRIHDIEGANLLEKNEAFMDCLQNGVAVEDRVLSVGRAKQQEYRSVVASLIDFQNPDNNTFQVVNQFTVQQFEVKRADIVVFVNGLPLVVIELKSPSNQSVGETDAYNQIRNYQDKVPCLFHYNCFNVVSDLNTNRAGTITSKYERYMEWKTVDGVVETAKVADFDTFFRGIFRKDHFLSLVRNFICFSKDEGRTSKILAGYHQFFAVRKALERTRAAVASDGRIGVFWHTQGSGKSLSMVFFAHLLISTFPGSTIVVVTDRKDLDQQLFAQFARCRDFVRTAPSNASSRDELASLLKDRKSGGLVFTTIQKFEEGDGPLSERHNIIVMADEAHRSQYGDEHWDTKSRTMKKGFALRMREALPNASFIGFTGTPVSSRDRDTTEVFGNYIDIYDMTQSVEDGATKPVYYESRVLNLNLNQEIVSQIDSEFDTLLALGATDEQVERSKRDVSRLEAVLSADETIESLVTDIITHYEENRAGHLTGKAMIVALTRAVGIKIYRKILEKRPDWADKVKVVMTASNKDPEEWHSILGNDAYRKELARKFKDDQDPMKIAIVRDMWLTGFDVPSLATMYVYKAMSGHNLMQAIARVNRVFPEKEGGLIVDYIGIAQALKRAMNDYTQRDRSRFGDPDITKTAYTKFLTELDICRDQVHGFDYHIFIHGTDTQRATTLTDALNYMLSPALTDRMKELQDHSQLLHNAVTLCRSLLTKDLKTEVAFFDALRVMLMRFTATASKVTKKEINERISQLLSQSIHSEGVINLFDKKTEFSLFDDAFMDELRRMRQKNLARKILEQLLRDRIRKFNGINVVQSQKFSDLLSQSLSQYIKGMLTNEQVIEEMIKMSRDISAQEQSGKDLGLDADEKAFYDALSKPEMVRKAYTDAEFVSLTKELTETLRKNRTIDWNKKESARAKMRVMIKRLLKKHKYPPEGAEEALETVMRQCDCWADNPGNFTAAPEEHATEFRDDTFVPRMAAEDGGKFGE